MVNMHFRGVALRGQVADYRGAAVLEVDTRHFPIAMGYLDGHLGEIGAWLVAEKVAAGDPAARILASNLLRKARCRP